MPAPCPPHPTLSPENRGEGKVYQSRKLNPSCPPFAKGRNSPLREREVRGEFGKIFLVNNGLINKAAY